MTDDTARAASLRSFLASMVANWTGPGWDAVHGGFHERLTPALAPAGPAHRRLHLCARQLYIMSHAPVLLGAEIPAGRAAALFRILAENFRDPRHGGYYATLDPAGAPLDRRKDLYGHAFVLFALARYYDATGDAAALSLARATHEVVQSRFAVPGGWFAASAAEDWSVPDPALVQNPNMHLLEAYLALDTADYDPVWRDSADRLVELFHRHLYDPATRSLGEFGDAAGRPHPETGHIVEPGHQFEWAWLLSDHAARRGRAEPEAADALIASGERLGRDPHWDGLYDRVDRQGAILADTKRIWPVCEAIKAYALRWRRRGDPADRAAMLRWLDFLAQHYLLSGGRWHEILNRDLSPLLSEMPGTTPYHLLMMAEAALPVLDESVEQG